MGLPLRFKLKACFSRCRLLGHLLGQMGVVGIRDVVLPAKVVVQRLNLLQHVFLWEWNKRPAKQQAFNNGNGENST